MDSVETLSVVIPQYKTGGSAAELLERLADAATDAPYLVEVLFVDDSCPDRSHEAVLASLRTFRLSPRFRVRVLLLPKNCGQHAAILVGVAAATGSLVAIMDGDLQDSPEDLRLLVDHFLSFRFSGTPATDALVAQRVGAYESAGRQLSGRLFRRLIHLQTRGRIPKNGGLFLVMNTIAVQRLLQLNDPGVHVLAGLARTSCHLGGIPIQRVRRTQGQSAYSGRLRCMQAARILTVNTPIYPLIAAHRDRRRVTAIEFDTASALPTPHQLFPDTTACLRETNRQ